MAPVGAGVGTGVGTGEGIGVAGGIGTETYMTIRLYGKSTQSTVTPAADAFVAFYSQ